MLPAMAASASQPNAFASHASPFASAKDRTRLMRRSAEASGTGRTPWLYGRDRLGFDGARAGLVSPKAWGSKITRLSSRTPRAVSEPANRAPAELAGLGGPRDIGAEARERLEDFESQSLELERLRPLRDALLRANGDLAAKDAVVSADPAVVRFMRANGPVARVLSNIATEDAYLVKCVVAVGQGEVLVPDSGDPVHVANALLPLCSVLRNVESFYDMLGGVVGYQFTALELIHQAFGGPAATTAGALEATHEASGPVDTRPTINGTVSSRRRVKETGRERETLQMHVPPGPDLREGGGEYARLAASWGLQTLPQMAEIYPLGGAGDRLGLTDPATGEPLPAALLQYDGRSLLEGLLRDLTAREWLYYKVFGEQLRTPVCIMTSAAKGNHGRISGLIARNDFFGRGENGFRLFEQPLVPVVTVKGGKWVVDTNKEMAVSLKPGGHGAIWKLMHDNGVFTWLGAKNRTGAVVRQITNPMAGTDTTILALSGVGATGNKAMGFASCERHLGAAEGVNVLTERGPDPVTGKYAYGVSNVEYTVLRERGISDEPVSPLSKEARFPANTNVLYVGLEHVRRALEKSPRGAFPGMLVNLSKPVTSDGTKGGRLETSMQNIADALEGFSERPGEKMRPEKWGDLPTFVVYSSRKRITSSAKKKRDPNKPASPENLAQTPDGSFLDLLRNAGDLLDACGVTHPAPEGGDVPSYLKNGPGFIFTCLPAFGPLWDVISQKMRGGVLHDRAEVRLECAELQWDDVTVDGSLLVTATAALGGVKENAYRATAASTNGSKTSPDSPSKKSLLTVFDDRACGRVRLRSVSVRNKGVDWSARGSEAWSATLHRLETCAIVVEGSGEFDACGVSLRGDVTYKVPPKTLLTLRPASKHGVGVVEMWYDLGEEPFPSWRWRYALGDGGRVEVSMETTSQDFLLNAAAKGYDSLEALELVRATRGKEKEKENKPPPHGIEPGTKARKKAVSATRGKAVPIAPKKGIAPNLEKNKTPTSR